VSVVGVLMTVLQFYGWLIIAYVLLSWFPQAAALAEIRRALGTIVDPYLGLFRRFIPPVGALDISPIVAILVLEAIRVLLSRVF
jgi:YggT family protein